MSVFTAVIFGRFAQYLYDGDVGSVVWTYRDPAGTQPASAHNLAKHLLISGASAGGAESLMGHGLEGAAGFAVYTYNTAANTTNNTATLITRLIIFGLQANVINNKKLILAAPI